VATLTEIATGTARDGVRRLVMARMRRDGSLFGQLLDPRSRPDPYPVYARIREAGAAVPAYVGAVTADHATVEAVLRSPGTRTATTARGEEMDGPWLERWLFGPPARGDLVEPVGPESMIGMDGVDHARLRGLASAAFTPAAIARLRGDLTSLVEELLDEAVAQPAFDLMATFANVFPVLAICQVLGIPREDHERFKAWGTAVASDLDALTSAGAERAATAALGELSAYLTDLVEQRRRDPGDDVLSSLVHVEDDGRRLTDRELLATTMLLLVAGFETTVNLLGNGALALACHPEQTAWLRADPTRVPGAVEELLRFDAPVQLTARYTGVPLTTERGEVPVGQQVMLLLAGANRDPAVFPDPDALDLSRDNARRHLAFASGAHYCLGASLARLEGEVAFTALLERLPELRLAGPAKRRSTFVLRGLSSLPLVGAGR
jgi:hypothetical protein